MASRNDETANEEVSDECIDETKKMLSDYDFVRFALTNFHGQLKGHAVTKTCVTNFLEKGLPLFVYSMAMGIRNDPPGFESESPLGNAILKPDLRAFFPIKWATGGEHKVAMVVGDLYLNGEPMEMSPRHIMQRQFNELYSYDLTLMSTFEFEFMVVHENNEPLYGVEFQSIYTMSKHEKFLYRMCKQLEEAGIDIETFNLENAEGQIEMRLVPSFGMAALDKAIVFKSCVKELAYLEGYRATFMTQPFQRVMHLSNGCHFNHSLWDLNQKSNMMCDNENPNNMSAVYKHWLAGLVKHGPGMTALCCPTVNCYRRMHKPFSPSQSFWGMDNRLAGFRVKSENASMYLEHRLPSGASNPYLVAAATIAAGLDGVRNKLELVPEMAPDAEMFPSCLEEALNLLENDHVLVNAFGSTFIKWFCHLKREHEIKHLQDVDMMDGSSENLATERGLYFDV